MTLQERRETGFGQELERAMDAIQRELNASANRQHSYDIESLVDGDDVHGSRIGIHDAAFYHDDVRRHLIDVYVLATGDDVSVRATPLPAGDADGYEVVDAADTRETERYGVLVENKLQDRLRR